MSQNPQTTIVTVYAPDGTAVETTRLNALDLTRSGGYSWSAATVGKKPSEPEPTLVEEDEADDDEEEAEKAPTIEDEAKAIGDYDNLEDYLATFDAPALRTMIEEKFEEKVHPRTGKERLIEKYVSLNDGPDNDDDDDDDD